MLEEGNEASWDRDDDGDNSNSCPLARCGRLFAPSGTCSLHTNPMRQVIIVPTLRKGKKKSHAQLHIPIEAEEAEAKGQTWLHSEFKAFLSYVTLHESSPQNKGKT